MTNGCVQVRKSGNTKAAGQGMLLPAIGGAIHCGNGIID